MKSLSNSKSKTTVTRVKTLFAVLLSFCFVPGNIAISPLMVARGENQTTIKTVISPADLYVNNGTSVTGLIKLLPSNVEVIMKDNAKTTKGVTWNTEKYISNVKSTKSIYLTGTVTGTTLTTKIKVVVMNPYIKAIRTPETISVPNGTPVDKLNLPRYVKVARSDNKRVYAKVEWDTSIYDGNTKEAKTYELLGNIEKTERAVKIKVKVSKPFIAAIVAQKDISVKNATTIEQVNLPQRVEVKMSNGIKSTAKVTWDTAGYDGKTLVEKVYILTGSVEGTTKSTKIKIKVAAPAKPTITPTIEPTVVPTANHTVAPTATPTQTVTPIPTKDEWILFWSDEFDKTGDNLDSNGLDLSKWDYQIGIGDNGWGNNEQEYYTTNNTKVIDGNLVITPKMETMGGKPFTSSRLWTSAHFSKKYGKFEARIKLPVGKGFWPAFWMMPKNDVYGGWAASGEIDIMEARGAEPSKIGGTLHYGGSWPSNKYTGTDYNFPEGESIADFHTYAIEWEPGEIRWYVDGKLYQTQNNWSTANNDEEKYAFPAPFDQEFYIILNLAVGGNYVGNVIPGVEEFASNPKMEVDYVRVYELNNRAYKTPVEPNMDAEPTPVGGRIPDATGNLINDINFEQGINENAEGVDVDFGDGWNFIHNAQFNGQATVSTELIDGKNYAKVNVTNVGNQVYSIQLEQHTTLTKGRWYQLSFDAKADKARTLSAKLGGGPTVGWVAYSDTYSLNLTTEMQSFSKVFQMTKPSDILSRMEFNCATSLGVLWIGNVKLIEVDPPKVDYNMAKEPLILSGNHIYNGAFDKYSMDRLAFWTLNLASGAKATASVPENTRELSVMIENGGTDVNSIQLVQKGIQLLRSDGYQVTFKAKSLSNRTIQISILSKDGASNYSGVKTIPLTTTMVEQSFTFTMPEVTDLEGQFVINLGGNTETVMIDDVKMVRLTNNNENKLTLDEQFPLKNGDFSNEKANWKEHVQGRYDGFGSNAVFEVLNSEMKIAVANVGNNPWDVMLMQENFQLYKGNTYVVSMDIRSTAAREATLVVDAGGVRKIDENVKLTTEKQTVSYELTPSSDLLASFKLLLGKIEGASDLGAHDVFVDNIKVELKGARVIAFPLKNGTFVNEKQSWSEHVQGRYDGSGSSADFAVSNGEMKIAITNTGANPWDIMLMQNELNLYKDKTYMVSFDIRSSVARKAKVTIDDASYNPYLNKEIELTATKQTFSYEFQIDTDVETTFKLLLGKLEGTGVLVEHDVFIDNIRLEVKGAKEAAGEVFETGVALIAPPAITADTTNNIVGQEVAITFTEDEAWRAAIRAVKVNSIALASDKYTVDAGVVTIDANIFALNGIYEIAIVADGYTTAKVSQIMQAADGNLVSNGDMSNSTTNWVVWSVDNSSVLSAVDGVAEISINTVGGENWSTQCYQEGIPLVAGKTYKLTFKAWSTINRPIRVEFTGIGGDCYFNITGDNNTIYKATITPAISGNLKLNYCIGNVTNGTEMTQSQAHKIYLDDIAVKELVGGGLVDPGNPEEAFGGVAITDMDLDDIMILL